MAHFLGLPRDDALIRAFELLLTCYRPSHFAWCLNLWDNDACTDSKDLNGELWGLGKLLAEELVWVHLTVSVSLSIPAAFSPGEIGGAHWRVGVWGGEGKERERERELTLSRVLIASSCFAFCVQKVRSSSGEIIESWFYSLHDYSTPWNRILGFHRSLCFILLTLLPSFSPLSSPPSFFTRSPHSTVLNHPPPADPQHRPLAYIPSLRLGPQLFFMRQNTVV